MQLHCGKARGRLGGQWQRQAAMNHKDNTWLWVPRSPSGTEKGIYSLLNQPPLVTSSSNALAQPNCGTPVISSSPLVSAPMSGSLFHAVPLQHL